MKWTIFLLSFMSAFALQDQAQILKDTDGNTYKSVKIGKQIWMAEDLKVTHYRNGEPISNVIDSIQWGNLSSGAYCHYANDSSKTTLYNWYSVRDSRNIAPQGWYVPTDTEWTILITYLGGESVGGNKFELSGFVATGSRNANGGFEYPDYGDWWSYTESGTTNGQHRGHPNGSAAIYNVNFNKRYGFAVRCIKDISILIETSDKK
ncbi:MAG: fibrobacter succinogenes major paralogous domain-containing protein [Candidatus Kryptoniota bacterium]